MATINESPVKTGRRAGVTRMKKTILRIDMTPMVDLGFLLITFFVITTTLGEPATMKLNMPKEGPRMPVGETSALTVLLGGNKVYYYHGDWFEALAKQEVFETTLSVKDGLGKIIREKQDLLDSFGMTRDSFGTTRDSLGMTKEGRKGLMLIIKATDNTRYQSLIDALDETLINAVERYAIVKPEPAELAYLQAHDL